MTHFHDSAIKKALVEIAPGEKESIDGSKFGEIIGSWVFLFHDMSILQDLVMTSYCRIEESVLEDLEILRASPLIKKDTQIVGLKYDIHTGVLTQVHKGKNEL